MDVQPTRRSPAADWFAGLRAVARRGWLVVVLYVAFSLSLMAPVLPDPRTLVLGGHGDNVQYAYMTGWVAQSLLLGESPFIDPRLDYPADLYLTATDTPLLSHLAVAPATWLLGPVFGYNLMLTLAHFLTGYVTYLWIRRLTGSRFGGFVAGMLLLLAPYRVVHSTGHPVLVSVYALVLFFWALDAALASERPQASRLVLLGFAVFALGLTAQYYLVMGLISGMLYALLRRGREPLRLLRDAGPFALSVACGALIAMIPSLMTLSTGVFRRYSAAQDMRQWSLDPLNLITPAFYHPLWGGFFQQIHPVGNAVEQTVYLGVVALALAAYGVVVGRRRGLPVGTWLAVACAAVVFAIGTDLHISAEPINPDSPLWLPAYYLGELPLIGLVRVWARFAVVAQIFVALLAGVGAAALITRFPRQRLFAGVLGLLLLIDFLPGALPTTVLIPRPIDRWLAAQPGDFAVAFLPQGDSRQNYQAMYGSLFHGKHMPAYNHPEHVPPAYINFLWKIDSFPDRSAIMAMSELRIRYLLIDRRAYNGGQRPDWAEIEPLLRSYPEATIIGQQGDYMIVEIAQP